LLVTLRKGLEAGVKAVAVLQEQVFRLVPLHVPERA
jgi:hypothetical protein